MTATLARSCPEVGTCSCVAWMPEEDVWSPRHTRMVANSTEPEVVDALATLGPRLVQVVRADSRFWHTADILIEQGGEQLFHAQLLPGGLRNVRSITKSVVALLVGATLGPDVPTAEVVEDTGVTLHDLLSMQRGAVCSLDDIDDLERVPGGWRAVIEAMPHDVAPGTTFRYDNLAYELVGCWLAERTGQCLEDLAAAHLFEPLGITHWDWPVNPDGHNWGSGDLALPATGLARLGRVILDKGRIDDRSVVAPAWVERMCRAHAAGGFPEPLRYGYGVWVASQYIRMAGWAGQSVTIIPSLDAVIVLTGQDDRLAPDWKPAHTVLDQYLNGVGLF